LVLQPLIAGEDSRRILRLRNTNVDGKQKIMFAFIGIGRCFSNIVCILQEGRRCFSNIVCILQEGQHRHEEEQL
jgi:hypothetical protein